MNIYGILMGIFMSVVIGFAFGIVVGFLFWNATIGAVITGIFTLISLDVVFNGSRCE